MPIGKAQEIGTPHPSGSKYFFWHVIFVGCGVVLREETEQDRGKPKFNKSRSNFGKAKLSALL